LKRFRQLIAALNEPMIEKRKPSFDRMSHRHSVALGGEKVLGKKYFDFETLGLGQRRPLPEPGREQFLDGLPGLRTRLPPDRFSEKAAGAPVIPPANGVRVDWGIHLRQILLKERAQKGTVMAGETRDVRVQSFQEHRPKF